ncbi:uncharacterized protein LOC115890301 [Sitophilus oryzae]|uniref:Uncharacterized protein LOC115874282 n=1 Tax=Sitophilus oryzae TaxID=7048 RepID=A0A6J2XIP7_SITOR|nr:uncharacterized protein LOC115874282 [Sitophilus oryzae]XP_030745259.1 uncharacterized protein LOC115874282 [Sitophilus oryzae]XP_030749531.1 uncharacterized protein LOC115877487 [Sitophilus oryzae]XP_030751333.1 uncharacterized protein LOC115878855 [Sitophilus oryzae]XP_030753647.1 uncharacterized protein LOC115880553 [Sitophilus oryzae]XP_030757021.1 uncharacterized protein LOC115882900 [Sitophilus oryzae]XP_030757336.1 uncharacterized protein LOC115883168 [Sitophilus oryzae]XP_03076077
MPRIYQRKTNRRAWDENAMIAAVHEVLDGKSCNGVASLYDIPEPTLRRYVKKMKNDLQLPMHGGRYSTTFNLNQSQALVNYITLIDKRGFGLTAIQLRKLAYDFAEEQGITHRFNKERKLAGKDWLSNFIKDNKISLRTAEATSVARLMSFNKPAVQKFFDILREVLEKYKFSPDRIYNADESGLSSVPCKLPKVLSPVGTRRVAKAVSAERGKNTTVVCAVNAVGNYVPPYFIFGRIRMKEELLYGAPIGSDGTAQKNGWMCTEIFVKYLHHFSKYAHSSPETPVLLMVDNHSSHISLPAINYCRQKGIIMIGFPPHTTHRLQPLDVSFFGPLKSFFSRECDNHLVNHPGQLIGDKHICQLFGKAYNRAATVSNAVNGFKKCGLQPFDPFVFGDDDFVMAETTERAPHQPPVYQNSDNESDDDIPLINFVKPQKDIEKKSTINMTSNSPTSEIVSSTPRHFEKVTQVKRNLFRAENKENEPIPGTSQTDNKLNEVTLQKIRPFPKAERGGNCKRKKLTASVITSTPIKEQLEDKEYQIRQREEKKRKIIEKKSQKIPKKLKESTIASKKEKVMPLTPPKKTKESIFCPGCDELYQDPPVEDWISCSNCQYWWHEACSNYNGVSEFVCDYC